MFPYLQLGPLTISTYFMVISLASTLGALWFLKRSESDDLPRIEMIDFTLVSLVCGFAGARLLHVFYEEFAYYSAHPLKVFEIWNGGFVFLGGVGGGILGAYIFCLIKRIPFLVMTDFAAPPLALAYAVGRIGCFLNGCCYGRHCELPWAMTLAGEHRHPTQIYATLWEFAVLAILLRREPRLKNPGQLTGLWFILHSCGRVLMEYFRDDPRGEFVMGYSLASWLSVAMIAIGIGLMWPPVVPKLQD